MLRNGSHDSNAHMADSILANASPADASTAHERLAQSLPSRAAEMVTSDTDLIEEALLGASPRGRETLTSLSEGKDLLSSLANADRSSPLAHSSGIVRDGIASRS